MTPEEKQEILEWIKESESRSVEKALKLLPEVMGNLMVEHATYAEIKKKFMKDHKEFQGKEEIVASVVEKEEGKNPARKLDEILKEAVPEIRKIIGWTQDMDNSLVVSRPKLDINGML